MPEGIHHAPPAPPPPAAGPPAAAGGGARGGAPSADVHGTKGTGWSGQKGGGNAGKRTGEQGEFLELEEELIDPGVQISALGTAAGRVALGQKGELTIHEMMKAMLSSANGHSGEMSLSPEQKSSVRKLFNDGAAVRVLGGEAPTQPRDLPPPLFLYDGVPLPQQFHDESSPFTEATAAKEAEHSRPEAALERPDNVLEGEYAPTNPDEETRFTMLTTDPRAGFAPEGLAAIAAERTTTNLLLERRVESASDFVDRATGQAWNVLRAAGDDRIGTQLLRGLGENAATSTHLILDAINAPLPPKTALDAFRARLKATPKMRVLVANGSRKTAPVPVSAA